MESHKKYYSIGNESFTDDCKFDTLDDAIQGIKDNYSHNEKLKLFNDNHTCMIEKNVWNKELGEYETKSYTPFVFSESGLRIFATSKDWGIANDRLKKYKLGI